MDNIIKIINEHEIVIATRTKFDTLFSELEKMKDHEDSEEFLEFVFLLKTQLIDIYYQRIQQNLEFIASAEQTVSFNNKKELSEVAVMQLTKVLDKYDHKEITSLLKCTTLTRETNK